MRTCRRFPLSVVVLFCLFGSGSVLAGPVALAPPPVWQIDSGMAEWLAPPVADTALPKPSLAPAAATGAASFSPVQLLTRLADGLRNIRYKRGGRSPTTGFDCSGFVRYVFRQGIGAELPNTSSAQFLTGHAVARDAMRSGDLVFFRTRGKRVSHVGIYLGEGRFIHAPSSGKTVSVSSLSEHYWSRRFAGARRPDVLVEHSGDSLVGSS
ncbi:C40 family peptidase [Dokdonella immobilis]|uniref:Cell wall-associated hydrolase, NlpC family n=1 Tax=Dokdonella immobilis TaxID=578942 RepID=A0A1I4X8W5_9GAMM|nr:C40 family peptidase [Dokdonella immobilis]SFN22102.1 Cell wall-associated hydrolase, NlpC family [Dokdonella immobilis]